MQGIPLLVSTLSDTLKEKDKWLTLGITTSGITKKNRAVLFSVLEEHLVEWVDRANEQHVVISDDVLRSATENSSRQGGREGVFHIFTVTGKGRGRECFFLSASSSGIANIIYMVGGIIYFETLVRSGIHSTSVEICW